MQLGLTLASTHLGLLLAAVLLLLSATDPRADVKPNQPTIHTHRGWVCHVLPGIMGEPIKSEQTLAVPCLGRAKSSCGIWLVLFLDNNPPSPLDGTELAAADDPKTTICPGLPLPGCDPRPAEGGVRGADAAAILPGGESCTFA